MPASSRTLLLAWLAAEESVTEWIRANPRVEGKKMTADEHAAWGPICEASENARKALIAHARTIRTALPTFELTVLAHDEAALRMAIANGGNLPEQGDALARRVRHGLYAQLLQQLGATVTHRHSPRALIDGTPEAARDSFAELRGEIATHKGTDR